MAGLSEICSHVGAVLFYVEAMKHTKSCTDVPCPWNMPSHVDTIPYSRIADIDFTAPKPVISQTKSGAHLNNNCPMISDPIEVEQPYSSCHSAVIPSFNANNRTNRKSKMLFFNKIAKCKHKPCCLSLLSPFSDSYVPNAVISATINYFIYYPK